jgi:glutamine synthetase
MQSASRTERSCELTLTDYKYFFQTKNIDIIQFQFTTLVGDLKQVSFPAKIWDDMADGAGVDGSSLGFLKTEQSDMIIKPDFDTLMILPWRPRVARFICDGFGNDGKPHPADPRGALKKVLMQSLQEGYDFITRPELEWYFVNNEKDVKPVDDGKYMDIETIDGQNALRDDIALSLVQAGIGVKTIHHECGPGQNEIEFMQSHALAQADAVQTARWIAKTMANQKGMVCTFMPKPFLDYAGSGMHIHQWLTNSKGENIFAENGRAVCDALRWFVGGILEHVDAMTAFFNPTTNSYKRMVIGHEAPVYKAWGVANRTALIRIPGYEKKARIEYRATDAATNIYLASALLLAAGIDGMERKIEPCSEPTMENVERLPVEERERMGIGQLPGPLNDALDRLEQDEWVKSVLGNEIVESFLLKKRQEWDEYIVAREGGPDAEKQWEYDRYLKRV